MKHKYLRNMTTLQFNADKCVGCGRCEEVCPHRVFRVEERKAKILDLDSCMECGACAKNCPADAISVHAGVGCVIGVINEWIRKLRGLPDTGEC